MNAYSIGMIVGAVVFGFLWSRLWLWLAKRLVKADPARIFAAYAIAWIIAVLLGAFGFATEAGPNWTRALALYTPALALWLVVDLVARRGPAAKAAGERG